MALVQDVCVLGLMYSPRDAWNFALHNGATEKNGTGYGIKIVEGDGPDGDDAADSLSASSSATESENGQATETASE